MVFVKKHGDSNIALVPGLDIDLLRDPSKIDWFMVMSGNGMRIDNRSWYSDSSDIHFMD